MAKKKKQSKIEPIAMDEAPYQVTDNWLTVKLGDTILLIMGQSPAGKNVTNETSYFPLVAGPNDMGQLYPQISRYTKQVTKESQKDDIIISVRATLGRVNISDKKYCLGRGVAALRPIYTDKQYISFFINNITNYLYKIGTGTTFLQISKQDIFNVQFPLPPLTEQKEIVSRLESLFSRLDDGIASLKKGQQQLKVYRQSVLKWAFEGRLTEEWRKEKSEKLESPEDLVDKVRAEREAHYLRQLEEWESACEKAKSEGQKRPTKPRKPKELPPLTEEELMELPELPEEWCWEKLGAVIKDPKYGTSKKCTYTNSGTGVLRIPNIINGKINADDLKFATFDSVELETYRLEAGDLLVIRSNGSISIVGKVAIITPKDETYLFAGYLIRLRPYKNIINSQYLLYTLSSIKLRNQIESKAKSTSGVNNINSNELKSLVIPLCSYEEQSRIVEEIESRLSVCDKLEQSIEESLKRSEHLRQSILKKAFSGELTAEWRREHPELISGENSAEALLERIKKEKLKG